jgi:hypothetical protein
MDANFKSKRKNVSSEDKDKDPALSDGYAYFVPEKEYKEYLAKNHAFRQPVSEAVLSACHIYGS